MKKMIIAGLCALLAGVCFLSGCKDSGEQRVSVAEYGVFKAEAVKTVDATDTALKHVVTLGDIKLVEKTDAIVAKKGVRFGVRYRIEGGEKGQVVPVTIKLMHPPMTNPKTTKTSTMEQWQQKTKAGGSSYAGFTMDSEWEMVPGEWTFEVWNDDYKLAEKNFTVTR